MIQMKRMNLNNLTKTTLLIFCFFRDFSKIFTLYFSFILQAKVIPAKPAPITAIFLLIFIYIVKKHINPSDRAFKPPQSPHSYYHIKYH